MNLDGPPIATREQGRCAKAIRQIRTRARSRSRILRQGTAPDATDVHVAEVLPGQPVERSRSRVGIHDGTRLGIKEQHDRAIAFKHRTEPPLTLMQRFFDREPMHNLPDHGGDRLDEIDRLARATARFAVCDLDRADAAAPVGQRRQGEAGKSRPDAGVLRGEPARHHAHVLPPACAVADKASADVDPESIVGRGITVDDMKAGALTFAPDLGVLRRRRNAGNPRI